MDAPTAKYPHCDELVLHEPGECKYCDRYPERQQERLRTGVNFTGHHRASFVACPSQRRRSLRRINAWPGNRPTPPRDCVFCDYAGPSPVLYGEASGFVIKPLNPVTRGHYLVVAATHFTRPDENPEAFGELLSLAAWWAGEFLATAYNVIVNAGAAATQTVPHLHVHLVPRRPNDGLALPWT